MKTLKVFFGITMAVGLLLFSGCGSDDAKPKNVVVVTITAAGTDVTTGNPVSGIDLNGATSAADVPVENLVITITFDKDIDAATVSGTTVSLSDGSSVMNTTSSVSGAVITASANDDLARGTDYTLTINGLMGDDGAEFSAVTRSFGTGGVADVTPPFDSEQVAYYNFNGSSDATIGSDPTATIDMDYEIDRHGQAASAAYFNGNTSIIEIPNGSSLINNSDFTISFWLKTNTAGHVNENGDPAGMFVMGLGAFFGLQYEIFGSYDGSKFAISYENDAGATFSEDMWFPNGATDNTTGGWQGWTFANNLTAEQMQGIIKDTWYHVIYTFDGTARTATLYFNGQLMKSFDFNLWPDGSDQQTGEALKYRGVEPDVLDELALGFIHSRGGSMWDAEPWGGYDIPTANHYKGSMDDLRIFHAAFSASDAADLYNAEKP